MADRAGPSFEEFVVTREDQLLRTAVFLTGGRHSGEDLLQDVLLRAYRRWPRIDDPDSYVRRALVNAAASRWRRRRLARQLPLHQPRQVQPPHSELWPVRDELLAALRALPERQRAALVLRYLEDQSEEQIAALLGCSRSSVKTHTARGLERMRGVLLSRHAADDIGTADTLGAESTRTARTNGDVR